MAFNIGVNVVEVDGLGAPAITGAAVSVGAFNIITARGVPNRPTRITSFPDFVAQFGSFFPGGLGAYLVKGFFDNGGQTAYINRVVSADATTGDAPASLTLQDLASPAKDTLKLSTGFRGASDPGTWGNDLFVRVKVSSSAGSRVKETAPATVQGTAPLADTTDMSAATALTVTIDGAASAESIPFQASDFANPAAAKPEEIRDAINRRTTKLQASLTNDKTLVLSSAGAVARQAGRGTSLKVSPAYAALNLANMAQPTPGTFAAINANGTRLAGADSFTVGDALLIGDGTRTARTKLIRIDPANNLVEWAPAIANPGDFDAGKTSVSNAEFDLSIARGGTADTDVIENWTGLSMEPDSPTYAPKLLNDTLAGSRYLMAANLASVSGPGLRVPKDLAWTRLDAGRAGTPTLNDFIGAADKHTGFYAFDPIDVQLVCCERSDPAIVAAALGYCANRGDCMFVGSVPEGSVGGGSAIAYGQSFQGKKVYGALYGPYIKIFDPLSTGANPVRYVPPTGHVMGVYARIESTRGIHKAPAGDEANIVGALDVEYQLSDVDHTALVKEGSVNGIRAVPGAGVVVDASRTLSTDTRWLYVNVRLLFNYVKSSLRRGLRWVRQEPNRDTLWSTVRHNSIIPFLMGLYRQGAFGTGKPDDVFQVIVDSSNNPPDQVDQGIFKVEVYFYPSKPAETIVIIVGQMPSGASVQEA